ncbi:hypothetical protein [Streptomyces sp. NPDC052494]|uniref:hypothetical protein n=1 Tax=Streptomyces sp. NPDC052494 TaxID=3365692 RepID=UPI0037CF64B1
MDRGGAEGHPVVVRLAQGLLLLEQALGRLRTAAAAPHQSDRQQGPDAAEYPEKDQ